MGHSLALNTIKTVIYFLPHASVVGSVCGTVMMVKELERIISTMEQSCTLMSVVSALPFFAMFGRKITTFLHRNQCLLCFAVRCDKLASASMDYSARLWDVETGKMFREWNLESGARCVSLSCGDKQLAVLTDPWGDQSSMIHIFDTSSDKLISKIAMPSSSRTNRALWGPLNKSIITCNESGSLMSWDPSTKQCTIERNDHNLAIPDFTFHQKDQMTLITASTDMSATVHSRLCRSIFSKR
jgi:WD40 repeat protein